MKMLVFTLSLLSLSSYAQSTRDIDVSGGKHAPLYDCSIYSDSRDRSECIQIKRNLDASWDRQGYAVDCYESGLGRRNRESCLELADRVVSNTHAIDCSQLVRDRQALRQCETTKEGYDRGQFTSRSTVVVNASGPRDLCGPEAFDRNYSRWLSEKEKLEKRGKKRAIGGAVIGGIGIILGGSDDGATRAAGSLLTVGGAALIAMGVVDIAEANMSLPHTNSLCRDYYVPEVRMVTYERQVCRTTRWTERGWGYSRSYYEINCQTRTYVSYEQDFRPWHTSRTEYYTRY